MTTTERGMPSVFQEWYTHLPMQQQSVLVLALRGPDGVAKFHPCKQIVRYYRATVLKAAYLGRAIRIGEGDATDFMTLEGFDDDAYDMHRKNFFDSVDELPHHYYLHLLHGAQIIKWHHPHITFRCRWGQFYDRGCRDLHMTAETKEQMEERLSDWHQKYWRD